MIEPAGIDRSGREIQPIADEQATFPSAESVCRIFCLGLFLEVMTAATGTPTTLVMFYRFGRRF